MHLHSTTAFQFLRDLSFAPRPGDSTTVHLIYLDPLFYAAESRPFQHVPTLLQNLMELIGILHQCDQCLHHDELIILLSQYSLSAPYHATTEHDANSCRLDSCHYQVKMRLCPHVRNNRIAAILKRSELSLHILTAVLTFCDCRSWPSSSLLLPTKKMYCRAQVTVAASIIFRYYQSHPDSPLFQIPFQGEICCNESLHYHREICMLKDP